MTSGVAGVVLAAGAGRRLRPLSLLRPKALCPVANVPLIDHALGRMSGSVDAVAANLHHGRAALDVHLPASVHRSHEDELLGTAGALGKLRPWLDGRDVLVVNADAWCPGSLEGFVDGWDRERIRLLLAGSDELHPSVGVAAALMPWQDVAALEAIPTGLYEVSWRAAQAAGRIEAVRHDGPFVDCGTPRQYLEANLRASNGESVVGAGAAVHGSIDRCVVWPGAEVRAKEKLVAAIRADRGVTVLVR